MYQTLKINDDLYQKIAELYFQSFKIKESSRNISKKYNTSFFGLKNIGFFAIDENGETAAYYGVFPIILRSKNDDILVAQSGDTMTSPNHQKKGLFTRLAIETYQEAYKNGVHLVYGFPNENSYPGFKNKLDWDFNGHLKKFKLKNFTLPFNELSSKLKIFESAYLFFINTRFKNNLISPHDPKSNGFDHDLNPCRIKHDINFLRYKLQNPFVRIISINGFTLLIKFKGHLFIGDVVPFQIELVPKFISTLKMIGRRSGSRKTILMLSENHWFFEYLTTKITPEVGLPIGFFQYDRKINIDDISFTMCDLDTF